MNVYSPISLNEDSTHPLAHRVIQDDALGKMALAEMGQSAELQGAIGRIQGSSSRIYTAHYPNHPKVQEKMGKLPGTRSVSLDCVNAI